MTMVASTSVKKGQEIFNDYGQRPRSDLLRRYGYITDNAKKWDVVELDIETIVQTAREYRNLDEREMERRVTWS
jgi:SET domain-containing protein 6